MKRAVLPLALAALSAPAPALAGIQPRYGGELQVALPATPADVDPARARLPSDLAVIRALHATLLEIDAAGVLRPGLLATLPEAEPGGRVFRLRLRPNLRFHDGAPITSADVAASLSRLLSPQVRSPHGWIALAIQGSDAVREGKAPALAGVQILSETELRVILDVPFPDFPRALAAAPASVVPRSGQTSIGAGPFRLLDRSGGKWHLAAFDAHQRGRPYLDALSLAGLDGHRAARAFSQGELDLALRPEALPAGDTRELPALTATYAVVNAARLGGQAGPIRRALGAIDRAELVRLYVSGPAAPLLGLLPPAVWPGPLPGRSAAALASLGSGTGLVLLVPTGPESLRPVADRIQVKLFDRGLRVSVQAISPEALALRLASHDYDLAVASVSLVSDRPALAALELAWALGGPGIARHVLARVAAQDPTPLSSELEEELGVVPLFVRGLRATARPELQGLTVDPDGGIDLGDIWLLPPRRPR